jgi:hypothetical protein
VIILNKVDLASLGPVCDLEDAIRDLAPGARTLRARFGQVPPEAVLDVAVAAGLGPGQDASEAAEGGGAAAGEEAVAAAGGRDGREGGHPASVVGEVGFLSHEGPVAVPRQAVANGSSGARRAAGWRRRAGAAAGGSAAANNADGADRTAAGGATLSIGHHYSPMATPAAALGHRGFATVSAVLEDAPLCMACFACWVREQLLPTQGKAWPLGATRQ